MADHNHFHSLVSLAECKTMLGIDDAIEEYCMRCLLYKRVKEWFTDCGGWTVPLKEYPVREILTVIKEQRAESKEQRVVNSDLCYYSCIPVAGGLENIPFVLRITPTRTNQHIETIFVKYIAGYRVNEVPPDLKEACLELVAWKYARQKGEGRDNSKMPKRVKELLEPYRRRVI
jgi:uncharacterized phiE125 gp8 family phage protein